MTISDLSSGSSSNNKKVVDRGNCTETLQVMTTGKDRDTQSRDAICSAAARLLIACAGQSSLYSLGRRVHPPKRTPNPLQSTDGGRRWVVGPSGPLLLAAPLSSRGHWATKGPPRGHQRGGATGWIFLAHHSAAAKVPLKVTGLRSTHPTTKTKKHSILFCTSNMQLSHVSPFFLCNQTDSLPIKNYILMITSISLLSEYKNDFQHFKNISIYIFF